MAGRCVHVIFYSISALSLSLSGKSTGTMLKQMGAINRFRWLDVKVT